MAFEMLVGRLRVCMACSFPAARPRMSGTESTLELQTPLQTVASVSRGGGGGPG